MAIPAGREALATLAQIGDQLRAPAESLRHGCSRPACPQAGAAAGYAGIHQGNEVGGLQILNVLEGRKGLAEVNLPAILG